MSTKNPDEACSALHILNGIMGKGYWPEHTPDEKGFCIHCHIKIDRIGDRNEPAKPFVDIYRIPARGKK